MSADNLGRDDDRAGCGSDEWSGRSAVARAGVVAPGVGRIEFAIGAKRIAPLWRLLSGIDADAWTAAIDMDGAEVAVAGCRPDWWPANTVAGADTVYAYSFILTNIDGATGEGRCGRALVPPPHQHRGHLP